MKSTTLHRMLLLTTFAASGVFAGTAVRLPAGRMYYQTNERIPVAVTRSAEAGLAPGRLELALSCEGAPDFRCAFNVAGGAATRVEHVSLDARFLKPGAYTLAATADGSSASLSFQLFSNVRQSDYKLIHWGGSKNDQMLVEGKDGMGFNLALGEFGEESIPSGQDVMGCCLMGGGHQHWLRQSNDWSDPYVTIGAIQLGLDRAQSFRTMPNAIGAHLHDEPGLTWLPHPYLKNEDGTPKWTAHDIVYQRNAYARAFNEEQPYITDLHPAENPEDLEAWAKVCQFKLGFMDALWKTTRFAVERLKPGFLGVTQSQYGWTALHDGYYFNVARSMPVISGHGGYNDFWLRNFNPSFFLEFALPRQTDKPTWYLPEWYAMSAEAFREEHHLSFVTGIQGISTPPHLDAQSEAAPGIVECNRLYAWLGTIFTRPAYTRQPLALLYSRSNVEYLRGGNNTQLNPLVFAYMATKLLQQPITAVLDEDILDGTVAANHKAILLTGLTYLDPAAIDALAAFAAAGGTVIVSEDCKVAVPGAVAIAASTAPLWEAQLEAAKALEGDARREANLKANSFRNMMEIATPVADALRPVLARAGIAPAFSSDLATIAPGRQVRGEIEYLFAVNFTPVDGYNPEGHGYGAPVAATATLGIPDDGRPAYEITGNAAAAFAKKGGELQATVDFPAGQMIAIARPARPVGGVSVGAPVVERDFTRETGTPIVLRVSAMLMDDANGLLAGTAPMQVTVADPSGATRFDLFRATDGGHLAVELPLAANDAPGKWTVTVKELLTGTSDTAAFSYAPAAQCGALAGVDRRALYFAPDKENVFRFFRDHRSVSVVAPDDPVSQAAAKRVREIFLPYNVNVEIRPLAEAVKPRPLTDLEAETWCGASLAGQLDEQARQNAAAVGYNLPLPTILLGNPDDNPIIRRLADAKVLPFALARDMPGPGRGMIAWNLMTLGHDVEAIACIAGDEDGLDEAIGTLFTLATGLDPLTPFALPVESSFE
jgi:hypothetical protein